MTHTFSLGWARGNEVISSANNIVLTAEQNVDVPVPATTTNQHANATIAMAGLACLYLSCDQNITLTTNSPTAPSDTITILAGKPVVWYTGCGWANPFSHDISALYLTNAGAKTANVKARFGYAA